MFDQTEHCLAFLREGDRDRYLCALLTREDRRAPVAALYAFNLELARVRDVTTEPMIGEMRLQWWTDLINGSEHGEASANPVAAELLAAVDEFDLPRAMLLNMIEARRFDLYNDPMPDRNTFEGHAGESVSGLIQLVSMILDRDAAVKSSDAAGHAGVALFVSGCLLLMPQHRARGQVFVPADILSAAGLDAEGFLAGDDKGALQRLVAAFAAYGKDHLQEARNRAASIPPECFAAFLPLGIAAHTLEIAARRSQSIAVKPLAISQWRRQWWLWQAARRGAF
ncbi:phytoene/squalene synthase family protein [Hoeflea sp. WL0058]|uniref:Phytoene/squalene synthase family protein n=1 Tax=Flavimaribacter sediminis TaxID=2865987 RepID=A0AAE3CZY5_9HYPH|nr:phytoene/squalene synthase family protein [Flavimaribacter sediminis]MBW8637134.1 phytoene/squalene synthase family protein [Flavimaribacter sediminis]